MLYMIFFHGHFRICLNVWQDANMVFPNTKAVSNIQLWDFNYLLFTSCLQCRDIRISVQSPQKQKSPLRGRVWPSAAKKPTKVLYMFFLWGQIQKPKHPAIVRQLSTIYSMPTMSRYSNLVQSPHTVGASGAGEGAKALSWKSLIHHKLIFKNKNSFFL